MFRRNLGVLLAFLAINAFAGGIYAMAGATGIPVDWLDGSPFSSYFVPGLILFVVVGGAFTLAAIALFWGWSLDFELAALAGSVLLVWVTIQLAVIGFVSWLQPATGGAAIAILLMVYGYKYRHRGARA
jgi:hypothetical protein